MKVFTTDRFALPLPPTHTFPVAKYRLLREAVEQSERIRPEDLIEPDAVGDVDLLRVHAPDYVRRVREGRLTPEEVRVLGFPWSPELVERSLRSCGATVAAAFAALDDGVAVNLAGGTHHAFPDHGAGYCVFNDTAVAARAVQDAGRARRVVVIDCDVHQGDGTAAVFRDDPTVFTFSIHGARNYPLRKQTSDLDVELVDGAGDGLYLDALERGLDEAIGRARADLAIYLAGADPFEGDRLGRLKVTKEGLAERDRRVFAHCEAAGLPVAVTMAGGYSRQVGDTVAIQLQTVLVALSAAISRRSGSEMATDPGPR